MEKWQFEQLYNLPLEIKELKTMIRIEEFYNEFDGDVYVAFSGGKDSTVLLDLVRRKYPHIKGVFSDTGLEYPEIRDFVKTIDNVEWLKPKIPFTEVLKKYGFPVVSKEQSQFIHQYNTAKSEKTKHTRWYGNKWGMGKISEKWKYLINAPFKISDKCCDIMKKNPSKKFEKETGLHPIIGTMMHESNQRKTNWYKYGCNAFDLKRPTSRPLSFWSEEDIWEYIKKYNLPYSEIYDMGYDRTGCMFCLYGLQKEDNPTRFDKMKKTHPKIHDYCMNKLGLREVIEWINKSKKKNK